MNRNRHNPARRNLLTGLLAAASTPRSSPAASKPNFPLYDALLHRGKPNLRREGLRYLPHIQDLWRPGVPHERFDEPAIRADLARIPVNTEMLFVDIEAWPLLHTSTEQQANSIQKLLRVSRLIRTERPELRFGYYGIPPLVTYWPLVDNRPMEYAEWVHANKLLVEVADSADFIFPSLYTFYDDQAGWLKYAATMLEAARLYRKPVLPFLWFQYHDNNWRLRGQDIPAEIWRDQLQFCRTHADGIVLWGGANQGWSESAHWWQVVRKEFGIDPYWQQSE